MAGLTQQELAGMLPERRKAYEKRRKKVRRNRIIFASFVSVLIIVITVLVLSLTVFFKIDTITVNGTSRYDTQQIITASGVQKGKNLFITSTSKAQQGISSQLTYLSEVTVTRKLPSTIIIEVIGANASYSYQTSGGYALTDKNGKVLEIVKAESVPKTAAKIKSNAAFVAIVGEKISINSNLSEEQIKADEKELDLLNSVLDAIDESKLDNITEIDVTVPTDLCVVYQNRFRLNLGGSSQLAYKLKSAKEIIAKEDEISPTTSGEINLDKPGSAYVSPNDIK